MTSIEEYGPDNPRDWESGHESLTDPAAPYETPGLLRMHRSGYGGSELVKMLKVRATQLIKDMERGLAEENAAHKRKIPVHDEIIKKGDE